MTENQHKKANLVQLLIAQGWNPPRPTDRIICAIADDIERATQNRQGFCSTPSLTLAPSELRAIGLAATGLTVQEAADYAGISFDAQKDQIAAARMKLGAKNTAHAVAIAIREGILDINTDTEEAA
jgi:DNA-binding CsgD family transcriptional regulator